MATSSVLQGVTLSADGEFRDTVVATYLVQYDAVPTNPYTALALAQSATGSPVPPRRTLYAGAPSQIFANTITGKARDESRLAWAWEVTYSAPPEDESPNGYDEQNPLERPVVFNIEYIEREYVVEKAKNVSALSHGDGKGGNRAANTLGPIVNAAGKRPDEPIVETEQCEVLYIKKNFSTLAEITSLNRTFKRTTNSDTVQGYTARQLRYLLCESLGETYQNGVYFWPGVIRIMAEDTTDLVLDNVGYEYWHAGDADWKRAVDKDGDPMAEPINLKLDGDKGGDNTTTITYRHLSEVTYASLFS